LDIHRQKTRKEGRREGGRDGRKEGRKKETMQSATCMFVAALLVIAPN
jgi:hypothetical protein